MLSKLCSLFRRKSITKQEVSSQNPHYDKFVCGLEQQLQHFDYNFSIPSRMITEPERAFMRSFILTRLQKELPKYITQAMKQSTGSNTSKPCKILPILGSSPDKPLIGYMVTFQKGFVVPIVLKFWKNVLPFSINTDISNEQQIMSYWSCFYFELEKKTTPHRLIRIPIHRFFVTDQTN